MTAPECTATLNASDRDLFADTVVRTLPWVAITMPMKPEAIEMMAPNAKAPAV